MDRNILDKILDYKNIVNGFLYEQVTLKQPLKCQSVYEAKTKKNLAFVKGTHFDNAEYKTIRNELHLWNNGNKEPLFIAIIKKNDK